MLSQTLTFLTFLPIAFLIYYYTRDKYKWLVILTMSYAAYYFLTGTWILLLLFSVTVINYLMGIIIFITQRPLLKKILLGVGIALNLIILLYFKHFFTILELLQIPANSLGRFSLYIPKNSFEFIGLSFYIIQAISYLIDIKNGVIKAQKHFGYLAVYLGLFMKMFQGPIERAKTFIPQLTTKFVLKYENIRTALLLITFGFVKKFIIADGLNGFVNQIFGQPMDFSGFYLIMAAYFYAFQIFFDFSGYTDIVLGIGKIFNIELTDNFRNPYFANSIAEFWRRWHISFSNWLMDYIFTPIQIKFRKIKKIGIYLALLVTFLICGLWHDFTWTFIVWGLIQAFYMIIGDMTLNFRKRIHKSFKLQNTKFLKFIQILITFHLVCFSFVIFTSDTLTEAWYIITNFFSKSGYFLNGIDKTHTISFNSLDFDIYARISLVLGILFLFLENKYGKLKIIGSIEKVPKVFRWSIYYAIALLVIFFASRFTYQSFIYIQF